MANPALQATVQAPALQTGVPWFPLHTVPHVPQLFASVSVLTHVDPHTVWPPPLHAIVVCWHEPAPSHWKVVQEPLLQEGEPQAVPAGWPAQVLAAQTPDEQTPLWQVAFDVQAVPVGAPQPEETHGCPAAQAMLQPPQLEGSEVVVSHMPAHTVPGQVSVSPAACILYSTRRLASAPVLAAQVEPVRRTACRVAPAAKVITMGPLSDQ